ncbi:MAG: hypothetical protein JW384_00517 [Nitrosomonadaceae bacterium]|nr:hypothetical protein [Nitrosomonadaceae bacterium]
MDSVFFVDSAGNAWETCSADDNDAVAFGPRGCARRVSEEAYIAYINDGMEMDPKKKPEVREPTEAEIRNQEEWQEEFDAACGAISDAKAELEAAQRKLDAAVDHAAWMKGG